MTGSLGLLCPQSPRAKFLRIFCKRPAKNAAKFWRDFSRRFSSFDFQGKRSQKVFLRKILDIKFFPTAPNKVFFFHCCSSGGWGAQSITDSNRAMPTARETSKTQPRETKARLFFPLLPVGSQESVFNLKVPKGVQFDADSRESGDSRESFQGFRAEPLVWRIAFRGTKNCESQV